MKHFRNQKWHKLFFEIFAGPVCGPKTTGTHTKNIRNDNLVPRACDPREGTRGSGIIRCRKPGILAKTELRIPYQQPIRFLPETDYPRASRSFPSIAGSGNEIDETVQVEFCQWFCLFPRLRLRRAGSWRDARNGAANQSAWGRGCLLDTFGPANVGYIATEFMIIRRHSI